MATIDDVFVRPYSWCETKRLLRLNPIAPFFGYPTFKTTSFPRIDYPNFQLHKFAETKTKFSIIS